ncbi:thioredoxin family protein [Halomarina halobia]|uniref:Thioredoxin family protein n=1 Tax=Halomarina halobia TaxID=3033386 RepID=A0ABD6AA13_9EURY|nr:thioredoxin family protein [Halomarina sp. PSR21]
MTDTTAETDPLAAARERPDRPVRLRDGDDLDALVAAHDLVLVDFHTKGCTLCRSIEPVLGNVARATDAVVALLNPREDLPLVEEYAIRSVPTLVLFERGEVVDRLAEGFRGTEAIVAFVERRGEGGEGREYE